MDAFTKKKKFIMDAFWFFFFGFYDATTNYYHEKLISIIFHFVFVERKKTETIQKIQIRHRSLLKVQQYQCRRYRYIIVLCVYTSVALVEAQTIEDCFIAYNINTDFIK